MNRSISFPVTRASLLNSYVKFFSRIGAPVERALLRHKLPAVDQIAGHNEIWVPYRQTRAFAHDMCSREGIPDLCRIPEIGNVQTLHSSYLETILRQPTLIEALRTMASASNAQNTGCHIWLEVNENVLRGCVKLLWPDQPGYSVAETVTLSLMKSVVDAYVGQEYQPIRIILHSKLRDLGFKPDAAYGDTPVELGKPYCALEYPSAVLSACRSSVAKVRHHPLEKAPVSIAQTMSECLKPYLRNRYPSIAFAAELMGCSSRTLQRLLKDENTSYRRVVEGARFSMSIQLMRETEMSLGEICHELGYAELSAFSRAFHNWTGRAPSVYRTKIN